MTDLLENRIVTTRKEHFCWGCGRDFPSGAELKVRVEVDQGEIARTYWCAVCEEVIDGWPTFYTEDGVGYGEVRIDEDWESFRKALEGEQR